MEEHRYGAEPRNQDQADDDHLAWVYVWLKGLGIGWKYYYKRLPGYVNTGYTQYWDKKKTEINETKACK